MSDVIEAYETACRLLGQAQVRNAFLERALARAEEERDEAGRRVVELLEQTA